MPVCTCGKLDLCSCTLMRRMVERESNAKLIQFLMNLNHGYDNIRTQILSMDPLPSFNKVLGLLQKIERQKQITDSVASLTDSNAYASFKQPEQRQGGFQSSKNPGAVVIKHCDHCNMDGHTRETCFGLVRCPHCNKTGHNPDHCFSIRGFPGDKKGKGVKNNQTKKSANSADVMGFESPLDDASLELAAHFGHNVSITI
ncbi:uncharacterized protein LOC141657807 [Silene latifolia]|uniref:uncharacterized protein LOC141657807 n=1 Tax=Silene latifolia TaxID=37657 RepID=UPI003D770352